MKCFAILGREPELSIAEIEAVTKESVNQASKEAAVFDIGTVRTNSAERKIENELAQLQNRLGGTQKVGVIISSAKDKTLTRDLSQILTKVQTDAKLVFGISVYDFGSATNTKQLRARTQAMGLELKKRMKVSGQSVRLLTSREETLSSVIVTKNKLTKPGRIEIILLPTQKEILIGRTVAVQDFEDWSHRDYDRPARNAKRGMLPPKLARMMINLSGVDPTGKTLLDPFCGSGTVLMEGAMLGCGQLIGSDSSKAAVRDTRKNLDWLREQGVHMPQLKITASLASCVKAEADLIVTEPFLGKPRTGKESTGDIKEMLDELSELYKESFTNLRSALKPDGVVVTALPIHFDNNKQPLESAPSDRWTKLITACRFSVADEPLLYHRPDQFVGRLIIRARPS